MLIYLAFVCGAMVLVLICLFQFNVYDDLDFCFILQCAVYCTYKCIELSAAADFGHQSIKYKAFYMF